MSRTIRQSQPLLAALPFFALAIAAAPAAAQTYGVGPGSAPFGNVASGATGDTDFTVSASTGSVTRNSGLGGRVSTSAANATVTVSCDAKAKCDTTNVNVKVGIVGTPTGRAKAITAFNVASGTATVSNIVGSNPITFTLTPIGQSSSKTFKLGMTFKVKGDDSGVSTTTAAATSYYVSVAAAPTVPASSGTSGSVTMTPFRSLSMAQNRALTFGRVVRPRTGTTTITLFANGLTQQSGGDGAWLSSPTPQPAWYTVTGEGGKQLSINIGALTMNRVLGGGSIAVTTSTNAGATPALSGLAGSSGTLDFLVGGSFSVTSATAAGAYSGTFRVTVSYN